MSSEVGMVQPGKVDFYVAAGIAQVEATRTDLAKRGVDLGAARGVRSEFHERFPSPLVLAADVIRFFGPPEEATPGRLRFGLALWPDHVAEYGVDSAGLVSGYPDLARRHPVRAGEPPARSVAAGKAYFRVWHHTTADVRTLWGAPDRDDSWAPHDSWYYEMHEKSELGLHFAHGLLIMIEAPLQEPGRSRHEHRLT